MHSDHIFQFGVLDVLQLPHQMETISTNYQTIYIFKTLVLKSLF